MSAQLKAAVEILTELGWANPNAANVFTLPLGTTEQQKIVESSLKSGTWMGQGWNPDDPLKEHGEVSSKNALLYLLRIGFLPNRAFTSNTIACLDKPTLLAVLEAAEKPFAETIIHHNYSSVIRFGEHEPTRLGATIVQVIHSKNLPLPATIEYLKDWAALAALALGTREVSMWDNGPTPPVEVFLSRFAEHLTLGVELGTPATGPFSSVFTAGLHRGWISRDTALDLAVQGLTLATRPGDRKRWTEILTTDLQATPEELLPHAQQLHQAVATGETPLIEHIAVPLIPHLDLKELTDHALPALYAKTAKALTLVLKTLAKLTPHPDVTEALGPRIVELSGHGNLPIQKLAAALTTSWNVPQHESTDATPNTTFTPYIPAPPVWNVERFAPKPADLAAKLAEGDLDDPFNSTLASEELIHLIVEGAYSNPEETRRTLSGVTERDEKGLIYTWVTGKKINERLREFHGNYFGPLSRLGKIPCLLARPSFVDRSILVPDLLERLERYVESGAKAIASDLELAITRLDVSGIDIPATQKILEKFSIPISVSARKDMSYTVGEVLAAYIADPFVDPGLSYRDDYAETTIPIPETLWQFPEFFGGDKELGGGYLSSFPLFGDVAAVAFIFADEANSDVDHYCDQLSYRRSPLEPGMAMNLLSLYRAGNPATKERAFNATVTAFTRGLLRPNVADIKHLDWRDHPPTHLAQLIDTTRELADAGLLSVCWPLWEHILNYSHTQPKPLTGIHHVAHAMADYAPSITHAVVERQAEVEAAQVPALRTLATSKAKNKAVTFAKEAVKHLPVITKDSAAQPASTTQPVTWSATIIPNTPDVTEFIPNPETGSLYPITVKPSGFEQPLTTQYDTSIDFCTTGKLQVTTPDDVWNYLFWDSETASLVAEERTDAYFNLPDPTAHKEHVPFVVPDSFVAVMLAHLSSGDRYQAKWQLPRLFRSAHIGSPAIEAAMKRLLPFPDFNPGKALALLNEKPELVQYLWPMLTEPLAHAATLTTTPKWLNVVLDAVIFHQDTLKHHTPSHIPAEKWEPLSTLVQIMTKKSAAKTKVDQLNRFFHR
ncbi:MAG: hypothetical protein Q4D85_06370 [Corynebacterium sp.]|uniref:hypothetical protein n=1 Tax=Corynebacterium sp. TaxID=1720 RepID=UPI0026DD91E3|nr:hypothetical protein [Corynebacterium sp.]MDO5098369.1 hypothetical protein [Corynebacterium sp.]